MSLIDMGLKSVGATGGSRVTNAIAMASQRTGMDFGYLLGQAKLESGLNTQARASTSSATGLYQFLDQSWLAVVKDHGSEYGLGWAADAIKRGSNGRYYVADADTRKQILDLRKHPETASIMAAQHAADNRDFLEGRLGRSVESVDLYLAHFLGAGGASKFLKSMDVNPNASGASLFPAAARANRNIFYDKQGNSRSLSDIRALFERKLGNGTQSALAATGTTAPTPVDVPRFADAQSVQDYLASRQATLGSALDTITNPQPATARLAYLMLATFGR